MEGEGGGGRVFRGMAIGWGGRILGWCWGRELMGLGEGVSSGGVAWWEESGGD